MNRPNLTDHALGLFLVALFVGSAPASATNTKLAKPTQSDIDALQLKKGEPFLSARARILRLGWTPARLHIYDGYEYSGTEKELAARRYFEVDSCSMDAGSLCLLHYTKPTQCLRLETRGEKLHQMKVVYWDEKCPPTAIRK